VHAAASLFEKQRFAAVLRHRHEVLVAHDQPGTGVPAKERVVVARRADAFGLLVTRHRFAQPLVRPRAAARGPAAKQRLRPPFVNESGVVGALVFILQAGDGMPGLRDERLRLLIELLGDCQEERGNRLLVVRVGLQRIEADARRLVRLVQQAVPFGLGQRAWHRFGQQRLEIKLHATPPG